MPCVLDVNETLLDLLPLIGQPQLRKSAKWTRAGPLGEKAKNETRPALPALRATATLFAGATTGPPAAWCGGFLTVIG